MSTPAPSYVDVPQRLQNFKQVLDKFEWQLLCHLRVALPAIVHTFDPVAQTVSVQVAIREKMLQDLVPTDVTIRLIEDIPIVFPRAGNCALTLPVKAGDECLVIFADMCIDGWWQAGGIQNQMDKRRHDLSDGFAIVGVWNQTRNLPNYSSSTAQLRSDDGRVVVEVDPVSNAVNIQAPTVNVNGGQQVNIVGAGNTTIEGKNFLLHKHTGVQTGGGTSGPVF